MLVGSTHATTGHEEQVDEVGQREGRLGAQRAGDEQPEGREGRGAQADREHQPDHGVRRAGQRGLPAQGQRDDHEHHELQRDDVEQRQHLAQEQAVAGEGRGAQQLDHAVAALEAGGDGHGRERGRHHCEGQHAGGEEVDRRVTLEGAAEATRSGDASHERDHRDHDREQQLLAVAQHQPRLHACLRQHHPAEAGASGGRGEGAGRAGVGGSGPGGRSAHEGRARPSGELEEDVLEGALAQGERLGEHGVLLAPPRDAAERGGVGGAVDEHAHLVELAHLGERSELPAQRLGGAVGERPVDDQPDRRGVAAAGQLGRGPGGDQRAAVDDVDAVGQVLGLVHVVGGQHDRDAVGPDLLEHLPRRAPGLGVHAGGRLVDEHQLGSPDERDRQTEALLLAPGQPAVGGPAAVGQAEAVDEHGRVERVRVERGHVLQHLHGAYAAPGAAALQHDADPGEQLRPVALRVEPEHADRAALGRPVALAGLERRGLARAVGSEHGGDRSPRHLERQPVDGHLVAVRHHQTVDLDGGGGGLARTDSRCALIGERLSVPATSVVAMTRSAIEADGLVKHFGDTVAVDGVSFAVPEGSVLGLLGPNGAGKTTTVRMMTTLTRPTAGTGRVAGHDILTDPAAVRRSMGLTGQAATVDELLTGRENLRLIGNLYGLDPAYIRRASDELLERFSLADAGDRIAKTYSGGMRRRLDLAVSLIATPPVLFLDEPTTGLDPRSRVELWEVLRELVADGTTLLLTTQYLEEADQLADNIVVIDRGTVIAEGTPLELKDQSGAAALVVTVSHSGDLQTAEALLRPHVRRGARRRGRAPAHRARPRAWAT